MIEFRYDTQLLIEGKGLDENAINDYFRTHFKGDCLLAVGDDSLIKIHFHTNEPWKVLEYCSSLGEIYDIVVEDMDRQAGASRDKDKEEACKKPPWRAAFLVLENGQTLSEGGTGVSGTVRGSDFSLFFSW